MTTHFTIHQDEAIDRRIRADLETIVSGLRERLPDLIAVVLTGGFSRSEGSILRKGDEVTPLNDYDLIVIMEKSGRAEVAPLEDELAARVGIRHIDLLPRLFDELPKLPCTILHYDLRHGGLVLLGPKDILATIPAWHEREISLAEAEKLLFNRILCLLEGFSLEFLQRTPNPEEMLFLRFQTAKGVLGASDALLVFKRRYHWLYSERAERFALEYKFDPKKVEMVRRATEFKLDPAGISAGRGGTAADNSAGGASFAEATEPRGTPALQGTENLSVTEGVCRAGPPCPAADMIDDWLEASRFVLETLKFLLPFRYPYGVTFQGWPEAAQFYADLRANRWLTWVEIAEMLLLAAISAGPKEIDEDLVRLAGEYLSKHKEVPAGADWETLRRLAVEAWHRR